MKFTCGRTKLIYIYISNVSLIFNEKFFKFFKKLTIEKIYLKIININKKFFLHIITYLIIYN